MNDISPIVFLGGMVLVFFGMVGAGFLSCMIQRIKGGGGKIY
jgi:hypothetical protein